MAMRKWARAECRPGVPLGRDGRRATASEEHMTVSKEAAREGMVLLKNRDGTLPLPRGERIVLLGKGTFDYVKGGGGSGDVVTPRARNLYEGLCEVMDPALLFPGTADFYREYVAAQYAAGCLPGLVAEPALPEELLASAAAFADTAVVSFSRFSGEGWDRWPGAGRRPEFPGPDGALARRDGELFPRGDFYFTDGEAAVLEQAASRFRRVVVVLNTGGVTETARLAEDPRIGGVLLAWQGGSEGGLAAAELLTGLASPAGKLADTFARSLSDYPGVAAFHESDGYADYCEDIYVGYRYFETIPGAAERVVYPFGYGLSYTTFALSGRHVAVAEGQVTASVRVRNTGAAPGREVVQVYCAAPQGRLGKPARQLAGYQKTRLLAPGEEETITVRFSVDSLASYDDMGKVRKSAWLLERGAYVFYIGVSVRDAAPAPETLTLAEDRITAQLTPRMVPTSLPRRMLADGTYETLPVTAPHDPDEDVLPRMPAEETEARAPAVRGRPSRRLDGADDPPHRFREVADGTLSLDEFVSLLSDEDLACLLGGRPNTGVADTFGYGDDPLWGVPAVMTADGPAGLRVQRDCGVQTTAFPCATLLACTWDPETVRRVGEAGGREVKENNVGAWLTPAVCIHRNPLCGRNFEYYSEDPLLTGRQAAAMVRGVQSQGVAATVKHLALNNKETNRKNSDSRASERAIREIYLRQFELIVREARPWSIMSSYNIINGRRASENRDLLTGILREEWGFDGAVVTDWWTYGEHYKEVMAGNDVKMGCGYPERLLAAKALGALTREAMETAAKHILTLILRID